MKLAANFVRVSAVMGTIASLMLGAAAAQASPDESARAAVAGTAGNSPAERVFLLELDGTIVEAPAGTDVGAYIGPYVNFWFGRNNENSYGLCNLGEMCVWTANHYSGWGAFMGGNLARCEGFRWEGEAWQDRTYSIANAVGGGPSSIWNRFSDGTYRYHKYGLLNTGYQHDTEFSYIMDAWAFDPSKNCATQNLRLHKIDPSRLAATGVKQAKVVLAAGLARVEQG